MNGIAKVVRMLKRKPPADRVREQLFWLVDVIYACKSSGHDLLEQRVSLVESALGQLGAYLESGNPGELQSALDNIEEFAKVLRSALQEHAHEEDELH